MDKQQLTQREQQTLLTFVYRWIKTQLESHPYRLLVGMEVFPKANIQVETFGNILAAIASLQGLAAEKLRKEELDDCDRQYELLITIRAMKAEVTG